MGRRRLRAKDSTSELQSCDAMEGDSLRVRKMESDADLPEFGAAAAAMARAADRGRKKDAAARRKSRRSSLGAALGAGRRRRSSVGVGLPTKTELGPAARQRNAQQLREMYQTAIKLSTENKINAKNTWALNLIDHMDTVIEEEEDDEQQQPAKPTTREQPERVYDSDDDERIRRLPIDEKKNLEEARRIHRRNINFQRASCTLDASIKIYSYRVDDTWSSSFRVLENLARSKDDARAQGEGGAADGQSTSSRLQIQKTLETNANAITLAELDLEYDRDPLFHVMAQSMDKGGAAGMLLRNLGVCDGGRILLDEEDLDERRSALHLKAQRKREMAENGVGDDGENNDLVDVRGLRATLEELTQGQGLDALDLLPQLEILRCDLRDATQNPKAFDPFADNAAKLAERDFDGADALDEEEIVAAEAMPAFVREAQMADASMADLDGDDDAPVALDDTIVSFGAYGADLAFDEPDEDFEAGWAQGDAEGEGVAIGPQSGGRMLRRLCAEAMVQSDYGYFDVAALQQMADANGRSRNGWAGAAHWKFARRTKAKAREEKASEAGEETEAKGEKVAKKAPKFIDFFAEVPAEDYAAMLKPPKKAESTLLTANAMQKQCDEALSLLLPPDGAFAPHDLGRLFLRPQDIVPPVFAGGDAGAVAGVAPLAAVRSGGDEGAWGDGGEWFGDDFAAANDDDFAFDAEGPSLSGGEHKDALEMPAWHEPGRSDFLPSERDFGNGALLSAGRRVEKPDINYAKAAKRVDVRKLKKELWHRVEGQVAPDADAEQDENAAGESERAADGAGKEKDGGVSFQDLVGELSENQQQEGVTLPFYFICLLHLANEKGLELKGGDANDLSDFVINGMPELEQSGRRRRR